MKEIIITGHRNPDMDSVCSAWAYAELKNHCDIENRYEAIRCGHLNGQTKAVFEELGVRPPRLVKDINPRVADILHAPAGRLKLYDPVLTAVRYLHDLTVSILPVFQGDQFSGLVSIQEVSDYLMSEQIGGRPKYTFREKNLEKVLPGYLFQNGAASSFRAPIMIGAMPFGVSVERIDRLLPDKPVLVVGQRSKMIQYAVENDFPAIILTGMKEGEAPDPMLKKYRGTVFFSTTDTAETVRLLRLSAPVQDIMGTDYPILDGETRFEEAKEKMIGSEYRGLPVFSSSNSEERRFLGIVTRRSFIDKPKRQVIMVDHNEAGQSIRGIESAQVVEILDHHRFAPEKTREPIYIAAKPIGSTCTIVYQHYLSSGLEISTNCALILLSGILSDTVLLKSPTATEEDRRAVEALAGIADVDYLEYGEAMFKKTSVLSEKNPRDVVQGDFKIYQEYGQRVGIGQVEVVTLEDLNENSPEIRDALREIARKKRLDWVMLLVTNVLKENSKLICDEEGPFAGRLIYRREDEGIYDLPGILSRKKQLLPEVLRVLEELSSLHE